MMKKENVLKIVIVAILSIIVFSALKHMSNRNEIAKEEKLTYHYDCNFSKLDENEWYVGMWNTHDPANSRLFFEEDYVSLKITELDKAPYLLSKPFFVDTAKTQTVTIKRKVKLLPKDKFFAAGLVVFQTASNSLKPALTNPKEPLGEALFHVEYAKNTPADSLRPGKDVFRVLVPNWEKSSTYLLFEPIFGEWFEEEIEYNTKTGMLTYSINGGTKQTIKAARTLNPYLRIWMHGYGNYTGHEIQIKDISVDVKNIKVDNKRR